MRGCESFDLYISAKYEYYEDPYGDVTWECQEDKDIEAAYDYLHWVKKYHYNIGRSYTPINMKKNSKQQLLDIARDMGCVVYKSWNKSKIMKAIYPNLKF